jgi:hypothetical protein
MEIDHAYSLRVVTAEHAELAEIKIKKIENAITLTFQLLPPLF